MSILTNALIVHNKLINLNAKFDVQGFLNKSALYVVNVWEREIHSKFNDAFDRVKFGFQT